MVYPNRTALHNEEISFTDKTYGPWEIPHILYSLQNQHTKAPSSLTWPSQVHWETPP